MLTILKMYVWRSDTNLIPEWLALYFTNSAKRCRRAAANKKKCAKRCRSEAALKRKEQGAAAKRQR